MNELTATQISKSFSSKKAVDQVSLQLSSGKIIGLLGPNGAGKTTSFYMLVGLIYPDEGQIELNKKKIDHLPMFKRARLGLSYLPQESSIFRRMSVEDNIKVSLDTRDDLSIKEKENHLEKLLKDLKITSIRNSYGDTLSGGERRRVEIARSLAQFPKFMLFDEPFAGVDPITITNIQKIMFKLKQQDVGILITDHNVKETLKICDYAYILMDGKIAAKGTGKEIASSKVVKKSYLGKDFKF